MGGRDWHWARVFAAALVMAASLLGMWEGYWRSNGFVPSVVDNLGVWAVERGRAIDLGRDGVALMGASRIMLGCNPDVFTEASGKEAVMLAIDGSNPLPVLEDLAGDQQFSGDVVCSFIPRFLADGAVDKAGRAEKWVRKHKDLKWSSFINTRLAVLVQANFAFRYSGLAPGEILDEALEDDRPKPPWAPMRPDRHRFAVFSRIDVRELYRDRVEREHEVAEKAQPLSEKAFGDRVARIREWVETLEARGSRVAFVRFPSSGGVLEVERDLWPRDRYWDVFAKNVGAPCVHYADHPELSRYRCPDGSHLRGEDARPFTRDLARILGSRFGG